MILLIDNYDSFSYNLYQYLGELKADIKVIRNDEMSVEEIRALNPDKIVISPGPGRPEDAGIIIEAVKELGKDIPNYTYKDMWSEATKDVNGTYDVDDSVTALIRTEGPVITVHGAWAQNIGVKETYIDFMGDKGGIRLDYGGNFTYYTAEFGSLVSYTPEFKMSNMFENEINDFLRCVRTGEKLPSHIETVAITARMMQAIYDSAEKHEEIKF